MDLVTGNKNELIQVSYRDKEQKIKRILNLIDDKYIRTINTNNIIDSPIQYILSNLDPHSSHIPQKDATKTENQFKGRFIGIGIKYQLIDDTIFITRVLDSSPNKNVLLAKNRIVVIKKDASEIKDPQQIKNQLKDQTKGELSLVITRKNNKKTFSISIKKQAFSLQSIESTYILNDDLEYIKLNHFGDHAFEKFQQALKKLQSLGMNKLIFDLRYNPEGRVDISRNIVDEFLEENQLIVFTRQRNRPNQYYYSTSQDHFKKSSLSLYVLLNERSASANEIVSGALQDNDRRTIVGQPSFEKELIQQEINLNNGSLVQMNVNQYITNVVHSIQKNYDSKDNESEARPEIFSSENIEFSDALKFITSNGEIILGGGGITPYILISTETTQTKGFFDDAMTSDFLNDLALNYIDAHQSKLNQYTAQGVINHFDAKPIINKTLFHFKNDKNFTHADQETLAIFLKELMAHQLFGLETFY
ncbi:MAG: S41 family peptidase [Flavobacteriales bacterium AspAUS03]